MSLSSPSSNGNISHAHVMYEHIGHLCFNDEFSDVTFVVQETRIPAHKFILMAQSAYFRALLCGGLKESSQNEIELKDINLKAFKLVLTYVYTGRMALDTLKYDEILEVLALVHQYGFTELEEFICKYLPTILEVSNVFVIQAEAEMYQLESLMRSCWSFASFNLQDVIAHDSFVKLPPLAVKELIKRQPFGVSQVELFRSVCKWIEHNPGNVLQDEILEEIDLTLIHIRDLLEVVIPTELVQLGAIFKAIQIKINREWLVDHTL